MSSSFFGLNVAQQGLYTARTALDITNHNISNAETEGYSRQYGVQTALRPLSNQSRGMVGTGSEIESVGQYRNEYLDYKYWDMTDDLGTYEVKSAALDQMELVFNEPSDVGITSYFDDMFTSLQDLANNPSDISAKSSFINSAESFTSYLNDISDQMTDMQKEANYGVKTSVDQINSIAAQVAQINQQIGNLELTGNRANDLRDERGRLLDDLSKIVGVDINFNEDVNDIETCTITINGQQLVYGSTANFLEVQGKTNVSNPEDDVDMYDIYWESGKRLYTENPNLSGELRGYLDVRDGNNSDNFTATIDSVDTTDPLNTVLELSGLNRHDIPAAGAITVNGVDINYTSFDYDDATGIMEMNLEPTTDDLTGATSVKMGESNSFKGVPYYKQQLNTFVRTIAREFNELQESGDDGVDSIPLFVYDGYTGTPALDFTEESSYDLLTFGEIMINQEIIDDPSLLKTKSSAADGEGANDLVLAMIDLRHDDDMFAKGEPDDFMQSIISQIGIDAKHVENFRSSQEQLTNLVINQRLSISDVDLDEEATNLIKYQQAYNMSAKIMSVLDEIYNTTINGLGAR